MSRRLSTLHMLRTRVRTKSHGPRRCSRVYSADMLSTARACCLQHGRLFHSAIVMCALFPRPTWPEVHPASLSFPDYGESPRASRAERETASASGVSSRLVSLRGMMSLDHLPLFVVLFPFSFRVRGRVKGSKHPKDDQIGVENLSQRGMEGYLMDGRWITESGNLERNGPLCAFDRGHTLTKDGKSRRTSATSSKGLVHLNTRLPAT